MNYMVIAYSFFAKNILYISILFTMLCSFRIRGWKMGLVLFI